MSSRPPTRRNPLARVWGYLFNDPTPVRRFRLGLTELEPRDVPVIWQAVDDTATIHTRLEGEDRSVVIAVLQNEVIGSAEFLGEAVTEVGPAAHGVVVLNDDFTVTYTPAPGYVGPDTFEYTSRGDFVEGSFTDTADVAIDVTNYAPGAMPQLFYVHQGRTIDTGGPGVVGNALDPDDDSLTASVVDGPSHADTFTLDADGRLVYRAKAGYIGPDTITYRASDGHGGTDDATITIYVTDAAPTGRPDAYAVTKNTPLVVAGSGVLANDRDPDGEDGLQAVIVTPAAHGQVTLNPDGSFSYLPATDFVGTDTFEYKAADGAKDSGPITVTLMVVDDEFITGTIQGQVWLDANQNGARDEGEEGVDGAVVQLRREGEVIAEVKAGADGGYTFSGLAAGAYTVQAAGPAGLAVAAPNPVPANVIPDPPLMPLDVPLELGDWVTPYALKWNAANTLKNQVESDVSDIIVQQATIFALQVSYAFSTPTGKKEILNSIRQ